MTVQRQLYLLHTSFIVIYLKKFRLWVISISWFENDVLKARHAWKSPQTKRTDSVLLLEPVLSLGLIHHQLPGQQQINHKWAFFHQRQMRHSTRLPVLALSRPSSTRRVRLSSDSGPDKMSEKMIRSLTKKYDKIIWQKTIRRMNVIFVNLCYMIIYTIGLHWKSSHVCLIIRS